MAKKRHSGFTEPGERTPDPWRLIVLNWGYQIIHGSRVIAAISGWAKDPRKDPQAYADALLLVAAPELLAACEASAAVLVTHIDGYGEYETPPDWAVDAAVQLLAAIAKAHGREQV